MINKNSNSLRCRQCGMINWATDEHCRRCHQLLGRARGASGAGASPNRLYLYLFIFIAGLAVPLLVSRADPLMGDHLGAFFVVAAVGLIIACKFLLLFEMFKVSVLWGAAGLFLSPLSTLVFMANYWEQAKSKVYTSLAAILYCIIMIAGVGLLTKPKTAQNTAAPPSAPLTRSADQAPASKSNFLPPAKNEPTKKMPVK